MQQLQQALCKVCPLSPALAARVVLPLETQYVLFALPLFAHVWASQGLEVAAPLAGEYI